MGLPSLNENIDLAFGFFKLNFKILFLGAFYPPDLMEEILQNRRKMWKLVQNIELNL